MPPSIGSPIKSTQRLRVNVLTTGQELWCRFPQDLIIWPIILSDYMFSKGFVDIIEGLLHNNCSKAPYFNIVWL